MPTYQYEAMDNTGLEIKETIEAGSEAEAQQKIKEKGFFVTKISEKGRSTKTKTKTRKPSMYRVLLLNDDYTPMEFVTYVLERFFHKSHEDAFRIMLHVHQNGVGVCGIFTYEVAETKVAQVIETARHHQHPLQCTMEKD